MSGYQLSIDFLVRRCKAATVGVTKGEHRVSAIFLVPSFAVVWTMSSLEEIENLEEVRVQCLRHDIPLSVTMKRSDIHFVWSNGEWL